jgi:hypothetical protein
MIQNVQSPMKDRRLTCLNFFIACFNRHFWCKVVFPQYLKSSCVSALETLRYAVLAFWSTLVAYFRIS